METEITSRRPGSFTRKWFLETVMWATGCTFLCFGHFFLSLFIVRTRKCVCMCVCTMFSMTNIKTHCLHHTMHTQWFQNNNASTNSSNVNSKYSSHLNVLFVLREYPTRVAEITTSRFAWNNSSCMIIPISKDTSIYFTFDILETSFLKVLFYIYVIYLYVSKGKSSNKAFFCKKALTSCRVP